MPSIEFDQWLRKWYLFLFCLIIILLSTTYVIALPSLSFESDVNITKAKQIVNSINKSMYDHIDSIYFYNEPLKGHIMGRSVNFWNMNHDCYNSYIEIYELDIFVLLHELGHNYEFCVLKRHKSTEYFANQYARGYK